MGDHSLLAFGCDSRRESVPDSALNRPVSMTVLPSLKRAAFNAHRIFSSAANTQIASFTIAAIIGVIVSILIQTGGDALPALYLTR